MPHKKRTHSHQKKPQEQQTAAPSHTPGEGQAGLTTQVTQVTSLTPSHTPGEGQAGLTTQAAVGSKAPSQPRQHTPTSVAQVAVNPTQFETSPSGPAKSAPRPGEGNVAAPKVKESPKQTAKAVPTTASQTNVAQQDPAQGATTARPGGPAGVASSKGPESKVQVEVAPPRAQAAKQELADPFSALADTLPSSQPLNPNAPEFTGPVVDEHVVTSSEAVICGGKGVPLPPGYRFENTVPVTDVKPKEGPKPISTDEALDSLSSGFTTSSVPTPQKQEKKAEQFAPVPVTKSAVTPADKTVKVEKKAEQFAPVPVTKSAVPPADKTVKVEKKAEPFAPVPVTKSAVPPADKTVKVEKKAEQFAPVPVTKSAVPPADKTVKMEKKAEHVTPAAVTKSAAPPADKKAKVEKGFDDFSLMSGLDSPLDTKPKTDEGMSLDALDALGDTLGAPEPVPESPKIRPEDIVTEESLTSDKGVFVGEREDSLPPEYRFTGEKHRDLPPSKPEPSMDSGEALDILSGDFMTPSVAHGVQAPVLCPPAPPTQAKVKGSSPLSGGVVASSKASTVQSPMVPPQNKPPQMAACMHEVTKMAPVQAAPVLRSTADQGMSLDALEALGDTLGAPEPVPESPKIRPEDIVTEDPLAKTKGVLVGERDDTLPPEYRLTGEKHRDLPPPKPEPSMDSGEALDILSGDFMTPSVAHGVQAPVLCPPAPPTQASPLSGGVVASSKALTVQSPMVPPQNKPPQSSGDFALDALAGDLTSPSVAPTVKSAADRQLSTGTADALDILSNTLMDVTPVQEPTAPVAAKDIVKEKQVTEEKVIKMGERDDSLPPEYRPTKEDHKATADAKARVDVRPKQPPMDDGTALDLLSSDFSTPAAETSVTKATEQKQPSQAPMSGPVLDDLSDTLLPESITSKGGKPKSKSKSKSKKQQEDPAKVDQLSGQLSSDVVPASTNKGGKS